VAESGGEHLADAFVRFALWVAELGGEHLAAAFVRVATWVAESGGGQPAKRNSDAGKGMESPPNLSAGKWATVLCEWVKPKTQDTVNALQRAVLWLAPSTTSGFVRTMWVARVDIAAKKKLGRRTSTLGPSRKHGLTSRT
jgi:hypothetical protein